VSPSEEKRTSFWLRERWIRSFVAGQVIVFVRGYGESQPDPIVYFFSALAIVWRKIFSAFAVRVLACIKEIP
jgi:hypothetical protein